MPRFPVTTRGRSRSPMRRWGHSGPGARKDKFEMDMDFTAPKWNPSDLPKFDKNFYVEHPISAARPESEINSFRMEYKMTISGTDIPRPIMSFSELTLPDYITSVIMRNGWQKPTPIQAQGLPMALSGRDVVGIAQTGSGKTASFVIPALVHIAAQPRLQRGDGPICLIMVPTRELAQQVLEVAHQFATAAGYRTMCFYGGASRAPQLRELQRGAEICIATPGRLIDFIKGQRKLLSRVTYMVLDEADRMLDMGFEPQIRKIVAFVRPDRQTLMWSATWPREVQSLARDFLSNYIQVNIGSVALHANPNIHQIVEIVDEWNKEQRLIELLTMFGRCRCLIFAETKRKTDQITYTLRRRGFMVGAMHGDKQQRDREMTLANFKDGRVNILVATDVASRGLDIDDIEYVVNFDFPNQSEDYIHRIGRTARSNKKGTAYTFFTSKNMRQARDLIDILEEAGQEINPELYQMAGISNATRKSNYKRGGRNQPAYLPKPSSRFGNSSIGPGFPSSAPNFANQTVRVPNYGGGSSGIPNGSSLLRSSSSSTSLNAMMNNPYQPGLKAGGSSNLSAGGQREPPSGNFSQSASVPSFVGAPSQIPNNAPESTGRNNGATFRPGMPVSGQPNGAGKWDRPAPTDKVVGLCPPMPNAPAQQPEFANSNWAGKQWSSDRSNNAAPGAWNGVPTGAFPTNNAFAQPDLNSVANRRSLIDQTPPSFAQEKQLGMRSRGSSNNLNSECPAPNPTPAAPWPNFSKPPFPQSSIPVPGQANPPTWGNGWNQPYYGKF
ncbi:unnamed protein product [Calicophoron daubneyi]|uniref:RNA helicase n=1 Tax=Calicophoron daubneyi TaxID=300641 RepID=A0AAV2TPD1_CALDB